MRVIIEPGDVSLKKLVGVFVISLVVVAAISVYVTAQYVNQQWYARPLPPHRPYVDNTAPTPQTPLIHAGVHYGNGFWTAELVSSKTQVQWNLKGEDRRQNAPFRVNASTDVPVAVVSDGSHRNSYLAVCMDANALGSNKAGDPEYSSYFGWGDPEAGSIYFDRRATKHDNGAVYLHVGGTGNKNPNHVMIGDDYVMPFGIGKPGQVITVPATGNQLVWSTPTHG